MGPVAAVFVPCTDRAAQLQCSKTLKTVWLLHASQGVIPALKAV